MDKTRHKFASQLRRLKAEIERMLDELGVAGAEGSATKTSAEITEAVRQRICLQCGRQVARDEMYRRGVCNTDYQASKRAVEAGETTWDELYARGLMVAEKQKAGRKKIRRTKLDDLLKEKSSVADADSKETCDSDQFFEKKKRIPNSVRAFGSENNKEQPTVLDDVDIKKTERS